MALEREQKVDLVLSDGCGGAWGWAYAKAGEAPSSYCGLQRKEKNLLTCGYSHSTHPHWLCLLTNGSAFLWGKKNITKIKP